MDERQIDRIWLSYFGSADPSHYGIEYNSPPGWSASHYTLEQRPARYMAVSVTHLQLLLLRQPDTARMFRDREPEANIGHSIFIYRLR